MKVLYLTLLVVSIVMMSSMAQETNQTAQEIDQQEIKQYTEEAEKIYEHQAYMVWKLFVYMYVCVYKIELVSFNIYIFTLKIISVFY